MSKYVYIDKLDYIVHEYKNTYHSTMRMTPFDIKGITYIDFNIENILNDFEIQFRYVKCITPNLSGEVFEIKKVKNTVLWTYTVEGLYREENLMRIES